MKIAQNINNGSGVATYRILAVQHAQLPWYIKNLLNSSPHTFNRFLFYIDAKLEHYPIFNYPFFGILTIIVYSNLVTSILPKFMKNREPYNLKSFILVYNAFQIVFNGIIVVKVNHEILTV